MWVRMGGCNRGRQERAYPLSDENSGVVDGLGKTGLEDLGLESSLHEVLSLEGQHVIESHSGLVEHTDSHKSSDKGVSLEKPLGVLGVELEELSGGSSDLGESKLNSPDLSLVPQSVLSSELRKGGMGKEGFNKRTAKSWNRRELALSSASRRADSKGRRGTL